MPPELLPELAALQSFLAVGAVLFGVGLIGFLSRRNMIVMFLSAEMMLQGVSLSLVAWGRYHNDLDGQILVVFIIAVAACEAAIALALVLTLFQRKGNLDIAMWQELRESNQPPFEEKPLPPERDEIPPHWPHLPRAGVLPESIAEEESYRRKV
jgi:NADH-quinone oxidoreductase subunit K